MAVLRWILTLPVIIICVVIALANRQEVEFTYSPFHDPVGLDLYFLLLCALAIGFFVGSILTWLSMGKLRSERRNLKKEVKNLKKTLDEQAQDSLEEIKSVPQSDDMPRLTN